MIKGKPISPGDVATAKTQYIPPEVFDVINELIAVNYTAGSATVYLKNIREKYLERYCTNVLAEQLNIEEAYEAMGWKVTFDKPGWNEDYDAFFRFSPKRDYNANDRI